MLNFDHNFLLSHGIFPIRRGLRGCCTFVPRLAHGVVGKIAGRFARNLATTTTEHCTLPRHICKRKHILEQVLEDLSLFFPSYLKTSAV